MVALARSEVSAYETPRVLIVSDGASPGLDVALSGRGFDVVAALEFEGALARLDEGPVDLIVLDMNEAIADGVTLCRRIRNRTSTPLLKLTIREAVADRVALLEAGADDFLVKPFDEDELVARLFALHRRARQTYGSDHRSYGDVLLDARTWSARRDGRNLALTPTEFRILELLMQQPDTVLKRDDMMRTIWGESWAEADTGTLEVHMANLRQKLERGGGSRLIHTVRGTGYTLKAS